MELLNHTSPEARAHQGPVQLSTEHTKGGGERILETIHLS